MKPLSKNACKELKKLQQKKFRKIKREVIVEGVRTVEQAIHNGLYPKEVYLKQGNSHKDFPFLENVRVDFYDVTPQQMKLICDTEHPQDIACLFPAITKPIKDNDFILYLDGISDPGNLGTIIRTAVATGISGIVLSEDSCELLSPKVIRSSLGTVFSIPIEYKTTNWLKEREEVKIGAVLEDSIDIRSLDIPQEPLILVIGSEAHGIREDVIPLLNHKVRLPQTENIESLNAAIAASLFMYKLKRLI